MAHKMNVGTLRQLLDRDDVTDDYMIDIVGEHSGSFGEITRVATEISTDVDYKELRFYINA